MMGYKPLESWSLESFVPASWHFSLIGTIIGVSKVSGRGLSYSVAGITETERSTFCGSRP